MTDAGPTAASLSIGSLVPEHDTGDDEWGEFGSSAGTDASLGDTGAVPVPKTSDAKDVPAPQTLQREDAALKAPQHVPRTSADPATTARVTDTSPPEALAFALDSKSEAKGVGGDGDWGEFDVVPAIKPDETHGAGIGTGMKNSQPVDRVAEPIPPDGAVPNSASVPDGEWRAFGGAQVRDVDPCQKSTSDRSVPPSRTALRDDDPSNDSRPQAPEFADILGGAALEGASGGWTSGHSTESPSEDPFAVLSAGHDADTLTMAATGPTPAPSAPVNADCVSMLISGEYFEAARQVRLRDELRDRITDLKAAKLRAAEEDRFEDAARIRDDINASEAALADLPSQESAKLVLGRGKCQCALDAMRQGLAAVDQMAATRFQEEFGTSATLIEQANTDFNISLMKQRRARVVASMVYASRTSHSSIVRVWKVTLSVITKEAWNGKSWLGSLEEETEAVRAEVVETDQAQTWLRAMGKLLSVGDMIRTAAGMAYVDLSPELSDYERSTSAFRKAASQLELTLSHGNRKQIDCAHVAEERCAVSWHTISESEKSAAFGKAKCLAACGNLFVNRVLGHGGVTSLLPYPEQLF